MPSEGRKHDIKVEEVRGILATNNMPSLPLTTIYSAFYRADIVTRKDFKFIPIDFVNSRERVAFDIGGLAILSHRDICDFTIAVIDDELWGEYLHDFRKLKLDLPPRVTMIPLSESSDYFKQLANGGGAKWISQVNSRR